jgi:hypothetical protein
MDLDFKTLIMKYLIKYPLVLLLLMSSLSSLAQLEPIQLQLTVPYRQHVARIDELKTMLNNGDLTLILTNTTNETLIFHLEVALSSSAFSVVTNPIAPTTLFSLGPKGVLRFDNNSDPDKLASLFYEDSFMTGDGQSLEEYFTSDGRSLLNPQIPEGDYELCIRVRPEVLNQQLTNLLSNVGCATVPMKSYTAPLISRIGDMMFCGGNVTPLADANFSFPINWSAPIINENGAPVTNYSYNLFIVELLPEFGGDPNQVIQALQNGTEPRQFTVIKRDISGNGSLNEMVNLQSNDFSETLKIGSQYVVVVQAQRNDGVPVPYDYYSPACTFTYGAEEPETPLDNTTADTEANLPWECENGHCNEITVPTGGTAVTSLPQDAEVFIGCFKVKVIESTPAGGGFNGKGLVKIPIFSAWFHVSFKDLVVHRFTTASGAKLAAISGSAKGEKNNDLNDIVSDLYDKFNITRANADAYVESLDPAVGEYIKTKTENGINTVDAAFQTIKNIDRTLRQIGDSNFESGLPIGYAVQLSREGGREPERLRVGIFGMNFTPQKATMHIILQTPTIAPIGQALYFGAMNACFSQKELSLTQATFYLGGDLTFDLPHDHKLTLKGSGHDKESGQVTYLTLDEGNLKEIKLTGEIELNNDVFVPKAPATGKVKIEFSSNAINNFDDLILTTTTETPVALAKMKSFGFVLKGLSLDLSTTKNPEGMVLDKTVINDMYPDRDFVNTWTGIHVQAVGLILPSDFNLGNVARAPSATVKHLMIGFETSGVSFKASYANILTLNDGGSLGGLGFTIDSLNLNMVSNNIDVFYLKGGLRFGLFDYDERTKKGALPYKIDILDLINRNGNSGNGSSGTGDLALAFDMTLNEDIDLTISKLHTTFTLGAHSRVEYNSRGLDGVADRKLRFKLNGGISIEADDVNLPGMHFENFVFEGHDLKLDQFRVGFASPQKTAGGTNTEDGRKAGGFPISIEGFRPILGAGTNGSMIKFGFGFDIILNLKEGAGFGLTTAIDITTELDRTFKPILEIDVAFKKISIEADVSVAKISGFLAFIKEPNNKGFQGCITIEFKKPAPIKGTIQAMFGTKTEGESSYRYFYIEGLIRGLPGIIIPGTPIAIDGFAGGFWYNMKEGPNVPSFASRLNSPPNGNDCTAPPLIPTEGGMSIAFGIMFKEAASDGFSFNGMLAFQADLETDLSPETFKIMGAATFLKMPEVGSVPASAGDIQGNIRIAADIELGYDFDNDVMWGNFNVYLNVIDILKGAEDRATNRAGSMAMYFGHDQWYVYLGNPWGNEGLREGDLGEMGRYATIEVNLGDVLNLESGAYFCMGTYGIRQVTELPPGFGTYINNSGSPQFDPRASSGTGVAFGAYLRGDFEVSTPDVGGVTIEASLKFGFGFDLALIKYLSGQCGRSINNFGINGYYATGRIYGYVDADLDVNYDGEKYPIATMEVSVIANFGGPNPTWINGELCISRETVETLLRGVATLATGGGYAVADGAVKVWNAGVDVVGDYLSGEEVDLEESWEEAKGITETIVESVAPNGLYIDFSLGDNGCIDRNGNSNIDRSESFDDRENSQSIISYILPQFNSGETTPKLEPYQSISVQFSRPINETWEIIKPDGTVLKRRWYIKTVEIKRGEGGTILPHDFVDISTTEYKYWIKYANNAQPLGSGATVRFKIVLGLKEKIGNGQWIPKLTYTTGTGSRTTDDVKTQTFEIVPINYELNAADVKFSYPLVGQNYFLQNHGAKFIILNKFLPEFENLKREDLITKTYSNNDLVGEGSFKYSKINYAESAFEYNTPTLPNEANIKVEFYVRKVVAATSSNTTSGKSNSTGNLQSDIVSSPQVGNVMQIPLVKVYTLSFKTSKFNSFPEKMASTRPTPFFHPSPDSYVMNKRFMFDEGWDGFEVGRTSPTNSIYNNLVENSNGSRTYLGHFVSSASVTMNTPWHTAMSAVVEQEYNNGDAYSNSFWFGTQRIGTELVEGNNIDVTFEQHEAIRSEMRYPERLTPPTAGNYEFTFEYQYPVLERGVVKHFTQNAQPTTSTTQIGGNFTSIQIFTLPQSSTIYKTTVAYEGMRATLAKQQTAIKNGILTVQQANTNEIKLRGR